MPSLVTPQKLRDHIEAGYRRLKTLREHRRDAYQEYAGRFGYEDDGVKRHLNLVHRAIGTLIPHVASNNPEHEVTTDMTELAGEASLLSLFLDRASKKHGRKKLGRACLQDAFLGPKAIVYCGLRAGANMVKFSGRRDERGGTVLKRIAFDDYICDPAARCEDELLWEGHFYDVYRDQAIDSGVFDPQIENVPLVQDCDNGEYDSLEAMSYAGVSKDDRFGLVDKVRLLDIALYDDDSCWILTVPGDMEWSGDFLRVEEWQGPARGPYRKLEFHPTNEQPHGLSPVSAWREQAEAFYVIVNKIVTQAENTKRNLLVGSGASQDEIDEIEDSVDGQIVEVEDPKAFNMVEFGGTSKDLPQAAGMISDFHNQAAHNPDILSGTNQGEDTATEYSGKQAQAAAAIEDYQGTHDDFESELSEVVAFYGRNDPFFNLPLTYRLPTSEMIQVGYTAEVRRGDFDAFCHQIKPRSMQHQDPNVRSFRVLQLFDSILKAAECSMATGGMIDVAGWARRGGEEMGIKRLHEIVRDQTLALQNMAKYQAVPLQSKGTPGGAAGRDAGYRVRPQGGGSNGSKPVGQVRSAVTAGTPS